MIGKDWPKWLKYGLIVDLIVIILVTILMSLFVLGAPILGIPLIILVLPGVFILNIVTSGRCYIGFEIPDRSCFTENIYVVALLIIELVFFFLVGALISLFINKSKRK
jgi:hypothetical protein